MEFLKTEIVERIIILRSKLYEKLTAPIDAMWEQLYIAPSQHYFIEKDNNTIGFCCIGGKCCLLQIFVLDDYYSDMYQIIRELIESKLINSANLSSIEPISFNTCLSLSKRIKTHTLCFEHINKLIDVKSNLNIELATTDDISFIKAFFNEQVGMDDTIGYTENLVYRNEIFIIKAFNEIIATSECRRSDTQPGIADLGIIVKRDFQKKGIATEILQMQVNRVLNENRKPICSTTIENIASRRVIEKSGFYCSNIIFNINLDGN